MRKKIQKLPKLLSSELLNQKNIRQHKSSLLQTQKSNGFKSERKHTNL